MIYLKNILLELKLQLHNKWLYLFTIILIILTISAFNGVISFVDQLEQRRIEAYDDIHRMVGDDINIEEEYSEYMQDYISRIEASSESLHPSTGPSYILLMFTMLGPIFLCIISASIFGYEFSSKTAKIKAAHYGWSKTVISKQIAIIIACVYFIVVALVIGKIGGHISWNIAKNSSEIVANSSPPIEKSGLLIKSLITLLILLFYSGISAFSALILKNSLAGAVLGIMVPYAEGAINVCYLPKSFSENLMGNYFNFYEASMVSIPVDTVGDMPMSVNWILLILSCIIVYTAMFFYSKKQTI